MGMRCLRLGRVTAVAAVGLPTEVRTVAGSGRCVTRGGCCGRRIAFLQLLQLAACVQATARPRVRGAAATMLFVPRTERLRGPDGGPTKNGAAQAALY